MINKQIYNINKARLQDTINKETSLPPRGKVIEFEGSVGEHLILVKKVFFPLMKSRSR